MLAQRCPDARIDAIDIDEAAVKQARENFERSAFSPQLSVFRSSLQEWQRVGDTCANAGLYDLIVSNPPYFRNSLKNPDKGRELARHTDSLSYEELLQHSARLLAVHGRLALILPAEAEKEIRLLAERYSLYCARVTRVYCKESKPARRVLLLFGITESPAHGITTIEDSLVLENEIGGRSAAYSELCKEFYL
jgi:tRNA1Val (adenine37-N6)-methyltransferase